MVAVAGVVVLLITLLALVIPVTLLANAGVTLPAEGERRVRSLDRQRDIIREVERGLPVYPGSRRVKEIHETIADGKARALRVCWKAPAEYEAVRLFYLGHLTADGSGWQATAGGTRVFKKGRVLLVVTAGDGTVCEGTYQLNFSYQL